MRNRRRRLLGALIAALVALPPTVFWYHLEWGWTPHKTERMIRTELRRGATRGEVEAWLDKYGIAHRYQARPPGPAADALAEQVWSPARPEETGLDRRRLGGMIQGTIYNANVSLVWWRREIDLAFFFDTDGRLVGHKVTAWADAL
jgi:hypothetical protein